MKSYLADLISAFNDYTPLSKDAYGDIPGNDDKIIKICRLNNLHLFINVFLN